MEIELACMAEGIRRYTQAYGTSFLSAPLLDMVGLLSDTEVADAILDGTFDIPEDLPEMTKLFIKQLRKDPRCTDQKYNYISTEDHIAGWKKMKERGK